MFGAIIGEGRIGVFHWQVTTLINNMEIKHAESGLTGTATGCVQYRTDGARILA